MKKLLIILAIGFTSSAKAQLTLEHTYAKTRNLEVVNIEDEGNKYCLIDTATNNVLLYNEDHSLWKRINTTVPAGSIFRGVACISKRMIDLNDDIELAFTYYTPGGTYVYATQIYKEDGTVIKTLPDVHYCFPAIVNGKWKIIAYKVDDMTSDVYSVPGKFLNIVKPGAGSTDESTSMLYPNPMESAAMLKYQLPAGTHEANLSIYDMQGKLVRSYQVTDQFAEILVSREELPAGTYIYKLHTTTSVISTDNFLIK